MDDRLSIDTPEQIDLNYNLAGIGSRFCASFVDTLLIGLFVALGWLVIFLSLDSFTGTISNWATAIIGIITFAILWGYYINQWC